MAMMSANERSLLICETEKLYNEGYTTQHIADKFGLPLLLIDTWIASIKEANEKRILFNS